MSPTTTARHPHARVARRSPPARRVSGPLARTGLVAAPGGVALPRPGAPSRDTGVFERIRALPDHRLVDRALRGRVWIWLIGIALGGIVAMQVSLLKLNAGISRAVETSGTLERQNAELEASIARLSSSERIRAAAAKQGMVAPAAGEVSYVTVRPGRDPARAVVRMTPPSSTARQLMADGGRPPALAADPLLAAPATAPATAPAPAPEPIAPVAAQPPPTAAVPAGQG